MFSNDTTEITSYCLEVAVTAFQNGVSLDTAYAAETDNNRKDLLPGASVMVCDVYELTDNSDVELYAKPFLSFSDDSFGSQLITIQ